MSINLKAEMIRLAHANPELRKHLLPLIKEGGEKANTEEGAKKLYETYMKSLKDPSKSTKKPQDFFEAPKEEKGEGKGDSKSDSGGKDRKEEIKSVETKIKDLEKEISEKDHWESELEDLSLQEYNYDDYAGAGKKILEPFQSYFGSSGKKNTLKDWVSDYGDAKDVEKVETLMTIFSGKVGGWNSEISTVEAIEFFESGNAGKALRAITTALTNVDKDNRDQGANVKSKISKIEDMFDSSMY